MYQVGLTFCKHYFALARKKGLVTRPFGLTRTTEPGFQGTQQWRLRDATFSTYIFLAEKLASIRASADPKNAGKLEESTMGPPLESAFLLAADAGSWNWLAVIVALLAVGSLSWWLRGRKITQTLGSGRSDASRHDLPDLRTDSLTGLPNRMAFCEDVRRRLSELQRPGNRV